MLVMPLPCVFISESALPKIAVSLRESGWEVNENAVSPQDWSIGVRYQATCILGGERWCFFAQLTPNGVPSNLFLIWQPQPIGFLQWWRGMRANNLPNSAVFGSTKDDARVRSAQRGKS